MHDEPHTLLIDLQNGVCHVWWTSPLCCGLGVRRHPLVCNIDGLDRWPQQGVLPGPCKWAQEVAGARTRTCRDAPPCSPARRTLADKTPRRAA